MAAINKEMNLREDKKLPGTWREGESKEYFNTPGVLPIRRYVLNNRMHRVAGIYPNGSPTRTLTFNPGAADQPVH